MKKINFLNLGRHPITNNFLKRGNPHKEFFYHLKLIYHKDTKLISLKNFIQPNKMFNNKYAHRASASSTMRAAYKNNLLVHVWTVNDKDTINDLIDIGVNGIITDQPELLMKTMKERDLISD